MNSIKTLILTLSCFFAATLHADQPNIIFIFIDDMGWGDLGCYGNDFIDTPRLDQLASEGMRFTDAYAAGAVCSPTRCAVQSGQNQARIGITAHIPGHWRPFERVIEYLDGTGDIEIYHLAQDIGEENNLIEGRKGKVADLKKKLANWRLSVSARIPIKNPNYDPERAHEWWNLRTGQPLDSSARQRFPQTEKDL